MQVKSLVQGELGAAEPGFYVVDGSSVVEGPYEDEPTATIAMKRREGAPESTQEGGGLRAS